MDFKDQFRNLDFKDQLQNLGEKIKQLQANGNNLLTEEATKTAIIMPFIGILCYDTSNPTEVVPEFTADVGLKKGERVDFAIFTGEKDSLSNKPIPTILLECKKFGTDLDDPKTDKIVMSQLIRYFQSTPANVDGLSTRVGIFTNGRIYHFFSDFDAPNQMDSEPFMKIDLFDLQDVYVAELKKLRKDFFGKEKENFFKNAKDLKYSGKMKKILSDLLSDQTDSSSPDNKQSDDFVRFFANQVYSGKKITKAVLERFRPITKNAFHQFIKETTLKKVDEATDQKALPTSRQTVNPSQNLSIQLKNELQPTQEEIESSYIIRAILSKKVDPNRIVLRKSKTYCSVLLDDNNRKTVCRLYFDHVPKQIGIMQKESVSEKEERFPLENLNSIFEYSEKLLGVNTPEKKV
jgi:hypothetical protein